MPLFNPPVLQSLLDAKGDLIAGSADNTAARLAVGANDTLLVADSAQSAGVKWASALAPASVATTGNVSVGADLSVTGIGAVLWARKTADETINNSAALQNDDALTVSVVANAVYQMELHVAYNTGTTPGLKTKWSIPSGLTMPRGSVFGFIGGGWTGSADVNEASTLALSGFAADLFYWQRAVVVVSSTAGTLVLQWAQNTANASNSIVRAGSYLSLRRMS